MKEASAKTVAIAISGMQTPMSIAMGAAGYADQAVAAMRMVLCNPLMANRQIQGVLVVLCGAAKAAFHA